MSKKCADMLLKIMIITSVLLISNTCRLKKKLHFSQSIFRFKLTATQQKIAKFLIIKTYLVSRRTLSVEVCVLSFPKVLHKRRRKGFACCGEHKRKDLKQQGGSFLTSMSLFIKN